MPDNEKNFITNYSNDIRRISQQFINRKDEIIKIKNIIKSANKIFICGNGGSSATASHLVNDFQKCCGLKAYCLTDNTPIITAWSNDFDYSHIFVKQLETLAGPGDTLIVMSGSGNSTNIINAIHYALSIDMCVIALVGMDGGRAKDIEGINAFHIESDMQHAEDWHLMLGHIIMRLIKDGN